MIRRAMRGRHPAKPPSSARRVTRVLAGNLFGAMITAFYFNRIDPHAAELGGPTWLRPLPFFVVGFALIAAIGSVVGVRWFRPLMAPGPSPSALARRRALQFPIALAAITFASWVLAGLVWGVAWPLLAGRFSPTQSARLVFGITGIGGVVTTAFVFFASEHQWRLVLPGYFPDGDVSVMREVPRLGVRLRLLAAFLLLSLVPLSLLGVLSYTRATALLTSGPHEAEAIVAGLIPAILFIVAVGVGASIALATLVASSVAWPLAEIERAMAAVEHGDLEQRCPVVANDEIGAVADGFNRMVSGLRERDRIKETFGKYVTPEIRDEILAGRVALEGQTVEVTILFSDLRDFTPWVEATDPREVLRDLNAYFTEMEQAITSHGGLVLQFIGDEIEAVFGAPIGTAAHATRALRAAVEMRTRLAAWNATRIRDGKPPLRHGIGLHTGTVLAGNVGSAKRLSYALVGDSVNLASRIQDLTKEAGTDILVSATTRARLDDSVPVRPLAATRVKGRSAEVEVYRLA
jgi:class 3 adenylate cyclase